MPPRGRADHLPGPGERGGCGTSRPTCCLRPITPTPSPRPGGVPLLLPPVLPDSWRAAAATVLDGLHGLVIIAGGADVDPDALRSRARDPQTGPARPDRDSVGDPALGPLALGRGMPLLAICRGMQVLNVALGGTLHQHLPDVVGSELHCPTIGVHGRHDVRLRGRARLVHRVLRCVTSTSPPTTTRASIGSATDSSPPGGPRTA